MDEVIKDSSEFPVGTRMIRFCAVTKSAVEMKYIGTSLIMSNDNPGWLCLHEENEESELKNYDLIIDFTARAKRTIKAKSREDADEILKFHWIPTDPFYIDTTVTSISNVETAEVIKEH